MIAACDDKIDSSYVELTGEFRHIADIDFTEDISLTLFSFPPQDEKLSFRFTFFILSNGQSIEIAQGSYAISFIPNKIGQTVDQTLSRNSSYFVNFSRGEGILSNKRSFTSIDLTPANSLQRRK